MPTIRPSQSARLAPVSGCSGSATTEHAVDSREALKAAKTEILELRKQLGLPEELPSLQPPAALGRHMPESPGGFTPEPGIPRTAGSRASDAVSLPGSPRAESAVSGKHYGDRNDLSTADSVASSAWSERSALIRAKFKPTQQLFEQRFSTPRLVLTRGGRTRVVPPRNVTRYESVALYASAAAAAAAACTSAASAAAMRCIVSCLPEISACFSRFAVHS
jgi:hypothetical protein